MAWGVFTYIFGGIAILGPLVLIYWYWKAARQKFREFCEATAGPEEEGRIKPPQCDDDND